MGTLSILAQIALFTIASHTAFDDLITITMKTVHGN